MIHRDNLSGFHLFKMVIQAKDELIIEGNVEAARLQSGKNIVIKNGVSGGGLAIIEFPRKLPAPTGVFSV